MDISLRATKSSRKQWDGRPASAHTIDSKIKWRFAYESLTGL